MQIPNQNGFGNFPTMNTGGNPFPAGGMSGASGGSAYPPGSEMGKFLDQLNGTVATALQGPNGQSILEWANGLQGGQSAPPGQLTPNAGEAGTPQQLTLTPAKQGTPIESTCTPAKQGTPIESTFTPAKQGTPMEPTFTPAKQGTPIEPTVTPALQGTPQQLSSNPGQPDFNQACGMLRELIAGMFGKPPTGELGQCAPSPEGQGSAPAASSDQNWGTCG